MSAPVRRRPPLAALLATALAVLTALVVGFLGLIALALSGGDLSGGAWLPAVVLPLLALTLVVGVVLLLAGRSWLVLCAAAGALALLGLVGGSAAGVAPAVTAALCALPAVRRWVAARRASRSQALPS